MSLTLTEISLAIIFVSTPKVQLLGQEVRVWQSMIYDWEA